MVRHSHQDALSESEFDRLIEATDDLEPPYDAECLFVLVAAGRLGMRAGEISHLRETWIDWDTNQIQIPRFDPCDHGDGNTVCGYCRAQSQLAVENGRMNHSRRPSRTAGNRRRRTRRERSRSITIRSSRPSFASSSPIATAGRTHA